MISGYHIKQCHSRVKVSKPDNLLFKAVLLIKYTFKIEGQLTDLGMNSQEKIFSSKY